MTTSTIFSKNDTSILPHRTAWHGARTSGDDDQSPNVVYYCWAICVAPTNLLTDKERLGVRHAWHWVQSRIKREEEGGKERSRLLQRKKRSKRKGRRSDLIVLNSFTPLKKPFKNNH